jgi:cellulose synthase/poly-beta-1,6-N-acetylglucosamine synthase-like glycosyltransferase
MEASMEIVLNTVFWTLALYGLFEIIKNIIYISTYIKWKADGIYLIVAVKNQEEKIEGFLRSLLFKLQYSKEDDLKNIIVADLQSSDKTKEIIKKLSNDYDTIKVISWKECKDLIDNVDENK